MLLFFVGDGSWLNNILRNVHKVYNKAIKYYLIEITYCVHFSEEEVLSDWKVSGLGGAGTFFGG